ncbi:MAG: hypothetical protein GEU90_21665, partial [Gemmatimonas sp.]|nr:hypothetical protein [Gemmatimonas sp.]
MSDSPKEIGATGGGVTPAAGMRVGHHAPGVPALGSGPEFDLIRSFFPVPPVASRRDVRVGPGDDSAVVAGDGIVLTVDLTIE